MTAPETASTDATDVFELVQVPNSTVLEKVTVDPWQTVWVPDMVPGTV